MKTLLLSLVLAAPAGAVPVDLRTLSSYPAPVQASPEPPPARHPGAELMATRRSLNDLLELAELLQNEAWSYKSDADEMWMQWRVYVPAITLDTPPMEQMRNGEVFSAYDSAARINDRAHRHIAKLRQAEKQWWKTWHFVDAETAAGRDGSKAEARLESIKETLRGLAGDSNGIDASLRQAQGNYDFVRPLMLDHLQREKRVRVALRPAAHWNYAATGRPRPDHSYEFQTRYETHYAESLAALDAKRAR